MPPKDKKKKHDDDSNPSSSIKPKPTSSKPKPKPKFKPPPGPQSLSKKDAKALFKKERQKAYIAPSKPAPVRRDPLDEKSETGGLVYVLPGELVLVLRSLGKKAIKTREKALEELMSGWVSGTAENDQVLVDMLPVWLFHLPELLIHPSRQLRLGAANVQRELMRRSSVNEGMAHHLDLGGSNILGTLALAAHDIDPAIASVAREAWAALTAARIGLVATFAHKAIVDPGGIWEDVCPSPPTHLPTTSSGTSTPQKGKAVKGRPVPNSKPLLSATAVSTSGTSASNANSELDSLETTQDRHARIRVGGLGVLGWVISQYKLQSNSEPMQEKEKDSEQVNGAEEAILSILADPLIWACLSSTVVPPTSSIARSRLSQDTGDDTGAEGDARTGDDDAAEEGNDNDKEDIVVPGPGVGQPQVRKAAWRLLGAVVDVHVLQPSQQPSQPDSSRQPPSSSISQTESQSDETESDKRNEVIRILSTSILLGCTDIDTKIENGRCACAWQEQDKSVQGVMWKSLLGFLGAHPAAWTVSSPPTSNQPTYPAFDPFLSFLRALPSETGIGAGGGAAQVYPVVLVVLGSVPMEVLLAPASGVFGQGEGEEGEGGAEAAEGEERKRNLDKLFDAFWDPWRESQSTTPTGGGRGKAFNAFIQAVLECMVLVVRRVSGSSSFPSQLSSSKSSLTKEEMHWMLNNLVKTQIELVWRAVATAASSSTSSAPSNSGSAAASTKSSNRRAVVVPKPGSKGAGTQAGEEIADVVAKAFGGVLRGLRGVRGDAPYYDTAYETMRGVVKGSVGELGESGTTISTSTSILGNGIGNGIWIGIGIGIGVVIRVLKAIVDASADANVDVEGKSPLLNEVFDIVLGRSEQRLADAGADTSADAGALTLLDELLCTFGFTSPDVDVETTDRIDTLIVRNACTLLLYPEGGLGLKLLATYLMYRDGSGATTSSSSSTQSSLLWLALLEQVVSRQHASTSFEQALSRLLDLFRMLDSSSGSGDNLKTRAKLSAPLIFCLAKNSTSNGKELLILSLTFPN